MELIFLILIEDLRKIDYGRSMNPWSEVRGHLFLFATLLGLQLETWIVQIHLCHKALRR